MKKYRMTVFVEAFAEIKVEANNEKEAREKALKVKVQTEDLQEYTLCAKAVESVLDFEEIDSVAEVPPKASPPIFEVGDFVTINNKDNNRVSDLESDLIQDVADGSMTEGTKNKIMTAIARGATWRIISREGGKNDYLYEVRIVGKKIRFPGMLEPTDLIKHPTANHRPLNANER